MTREFIVRPEAEDDITDAAIWYEQQSPGLGWDFTRVVDACLAEVSRTPLRFPVVRSKARRALLRRFHLRGDLRRRRAVGACHRVSARAQGSVQVATSASR